MTTTIIGGPFLNNLLVEFDVVKAGVGLAARLDQDRVEDGKRKKNGTPALHA